MTLFAFLDIETTGLSPDDDHILEIAWLLTDSKLETLTPLRSHISEHSQGEWQDIWSQLQSNEPVRHMHQESGLLNAIRSHKAWKLSASANQFRDDIENARRQLGDHDGTEHSVHLAGLSISFDRDFLEREMRKAEVEGEHSVSELNAKVELSQSALSQHLAVLRADGLVCTRREAQTIYYTLAEGPAQRIIETLHGVYCHAPTAR